MRCICSEVAATLHGEHLRRVSILCFSLPLEDVLHVSSFAGAGSPDIDRSRVQKASSIFLWLGKLQDRVLPSGEGFGGSLAVHSCHSVLWCSNVVPCGGVDEFVGN